MRKTLLFAFLLLAASSVTSAGIIRNVIKPAVQKSAHVTKVVAQHAAHATARAAHTGKVVVY